MRQAFSARGNVARLYLGMDRAIPHTAPYPASIGYHPGRNALIAIATDSTGQITGGQFDDAAASGSERAACRSLPSARSPAVLTVAAHRAAGTSVTWRPGTAPLSPAVRTPILPACSACGRRDRDG